VVRLHKCGSRTFFFFTRRVSPVLHHRCLTNAQHPFRYSARGLPCPSTRFHTDRTLALLLKFSPQPHRAVSQSIHRSAAPSDMIGLRDVLVVQCVDCAPFEVGVVTHTHPVGIFKLGSDQPKRSERQCAGSEGSASICCKMATRVRAVLVSSVVVLAFCLQVTAALTASLLPGVPAHINPRWTAPPKGSPSNGSPDSPVLGKCRRACSLHRASCVSGVCLSASVRLHCRAVCDWLVSWHNGCVPLATALGGHNGCVPLATALGGRCHT
jgi:hypothetical protein